MRIPKERKGLPFQIIVATLCIVLCADSALSSAVTTPAPGWTFTEDESPVFVLCPSSFVLDGGGADSAFTVLDWRGNEVRRGEWPADGRLELAPLPPGYYRMESGRDAPTARPREDGRFVETSLSPFDFCVVRRDPCRHARDSRGGGVQIDLLIQTERSAYLVEIKRQNRIGREIEDEVETKMRRLPVRRGVSIHPVLVHLGEVSGEVDGDGFFDAIIPAESLLQSC